MSGPSFHRRSGGIVAALAALCLASPGEAEDDPPLPGRSVGMPERIEVILPGPELEAVPRDDRETPIVLRVVRVDPHGSRRRYELEFLGLEPGEYDLTDYLRRKDRSSTADLAPIPVSIRSVLPPGQVEPNAPSRRPTPRPWGYRALVLAVAILWLAGLAYLLFGGRRRRVSASPVAVRPRTLAERLRPLVEGASRGDLDPAGRAELERLLIGYWRRRAGLEGIDPARAVAILREHDEAGPVFRSLEDWLHRPPGPSQENIDIIELLKPYRDLPADTLEPVGSPDAAGKGA
ncbi:hypothetical protein [Tautonia plasticadhaerens]|uniref:Uncharacterized protein n=1 Tax=Tautonia plasticadhaerens TaxID=2527974 RepID=A0A518H9H2_9BACT|nr:hypothetical protein [Tautonia plasticadhaerens]QDV37508.1 hypothetical protein ElP_54480 [Tautonia plasticadhaerens]